MPIRSIDLRFRRADEIRPLIEDRGGGPSPNEAFHERSSVHPVARGCRHQSIIITNLRLEIRYRQGRHREADMRRVLFTTISLVALSITNSLAADLPRSVPTQILVPAYSWTGFYLGINGGYGWASSDWTALNGGSNPSGGLIGGTIGYNWQTGAYVFGLEGDIDWTNLKGSFTNAACPAGCETSNSWLATVRGRLGYAIDRVMPYATGGLAVGDVGATQWGVGSVTNTQVGWTVGAGVEAAVAANWTAKIEYLYVDLGNVNCGTCTAGTAANFKANIVRAGLNWRF